MAERDGYIPGVPCWADTTQPDPEAAVDFYRGLFGWEFEDVMPPGGPVRYFIARIRGGDVAAVSSGQETGTQATWNTYVQVESADEAASEVEAAGGTVLTQPVDVLQAGRTAGCADPEGARFLVWQPGRHRGARIINEPGAVNFNGLHTRDLPAAERFYGALFGWRTLTMDGGAMAWMLPGYGDHLELRDPGLRERTRSFGAPEGFEDVVATVETISDDSPEASPHWSVTFAVDDADEVAQRARELGGQVLVEPFDAPWVRLTLIGDPQGASFVASRFTPENRDVATA